MQIKNKTLISAIAFSVMAVTGQASADVFWDGTDTTLDADGGNGTWDNTATNWDDLAIAGTNAAWDSDVAVFGPTAGTVTLGDNITANQLYFNAGGYIIDGAGNTITLGTSGGKRETGSIFLDESGTNTFNVNINNDGNLLTFSADRSSNRNAVVTGVISGSGGLETYQNARVTLSGANTYTGQTKITADTTTGSGITVSSFNSVNGGTPLMASSSLGAPTTVANGTIEIGTSGKRASSTLTYAGAAATGETTDRVIRILFNSSSSQTLNASGSGLLKFTSAFTSNAGSQTGSFNLRGTGSGEIVQDLPALATGGLRKLDSGTWTIAGGDVNRVRVEGGTLVVNGSLNSATTTSVSSGATLDLVDDSELVFVIEGTGVNNSLIGSGTANLDGDLLLDLTAAGTTLGDTWDLIDVGSLSETFDANFLIRSTLGSFSESGGVWSIAENGTNYEFDESTGDLTVVVPEPGSLALLGLGGLLIASRRRRG